MYDNLTKDELIAELARMKKYYTLLVRAIIHHYNPDHEDSITREFPKPVSEE